MDYVIEWLLLRPLAFIIDLKDGDLKYRGKNTGLLEDIEEDEQRKIVIDIYRALMKEYLDLLDAVFLGINSPEDFIIPDYWLCLSYTSFIRKLKSFRYNEDIKKLPTFEFDDYINLEVNSEGMIEEYPEKRKRIQEYRAHIENLFYKVCKMEGNLPDDTKNDMDYDYDLIQQHKDRRGVVKSKPQRPTLKFVKEKDNNKKHVYSILDKNINEWIDKKYIKKMVRINDDDFRSIISQLRKDIIKQRYIDELKIENDKQGRYRLTLLASN